MFEDLSIVDIIGILLGILALISVYSSPKIADKFIKYQDKDAVDACSLKIKIASFVLAVIAFLLVVVF
jgi:hypothetical protein